MNDYERNILALIVEGWILEIGSHNKNIGDIRAGGSLMERMSNVVESLRSEEEE